MNEDYFSAEFKRIIAELREYCRSQQHLWQRLPLLALRANGITGYNAHYAIAARYGYWSVSYEAWQVCVDCATGELVHPQNDFRGPAKPIWERHLIPLLDEPRRLNAQRTLDRLTIEAADGPRPYMDIQARNRYLREETAQFGITELFTREETVAA